MESPKGVGVDRIIGNNLHNKNTKKMTNFEIYIFDSSSNVYIISDYLGKVGEGVVVEVIHNVIIVEYPVHSHQGYRYHRVLSP